MNYFLPWLTPKPDRRYTCSYVHHSSWVRDDIDLSNSWVRKYNNLLLTCNTTRLWWYQTIMPKSLRRLLSIIYVQVSDNLKVVTTQMFATTAISHVHATALHFVESSRFLHSKSWQLCKSYRYAFKRPMFDWERKTVLHGYLPSQKNLRIITNIPALYCDTTGHSCVVKITEICSGLEQIKFLCSTIRISLYYYGDIKVLAFSSTRLAPMSSRSEFRSSNSPKPRV